MASPKTEEAGGGNMAEEQPKGGGNSLQVSSLVALLLAALRRSMMSSCRVDRRRDGDDVAVAVTLSPMEIGWPTDVKHVTHVTFDRFNGFLGLPIEFELEVPTKAPSARSVCNTSFFVFGSVPVKSEIRFLAQCPVTLKLFRSSNFSDFVPSLQEGGRI